MNLKNACYFKVKNTLKKLFTHICYLPIFLTEIVKRPKNLRENALFTFHVASLYIISLILPSSLLQMKYHQNSLVTQKILKRS